MDVNELIYNFIHQHPLIYSMSPPQPSHSCYLFLYTSVVPPFIWILVEIYHDTVVAILQFSQKILNYHNTKRVFGLWNEIVHQEEELFDWSTS